MVARLQWHTGPGDPAGWHPWQQRRGWRHLAVDPDLDADLGLGLAAQPPGSQRAAELAASLSTALALDAAANLLHGPPPASPRPLRRGAYQVHATGLAVDVVP